MTEYVVLKQTGTAAAWTWIGRATATGALQAIRQVADSENEGVFVAVPARSWQPVKRDVEVKRTDHFERIEPAATKGTA